ncbi:MAG: diguanylate cyclase [Candidatus Magnetomorum sp.]|nr:diguanylate cyclase [Candidatus Magnetomorum sp.]
MKMLIATDDQTLMSQLRTSIDGSTFDISELSDFKLMSTFIASPENKPQLIIIDSKIPDFDADMCKKQLKSDNGLQCIVILLVDVDLDGVMYEEADGVLSVSIDRLKPLDMIPIINFGRNYLYLNEDLTAQRKKCLGLEIENKRLKQMIVERSRTDDLTGVLNRQFLFEQGEKEMRRAKRYNHALSVLMMDIDHFKRINDNFGHAVGDRVLKSFAKRCYETIRESDFFGRIGGEEFVAILPESSKEAAMMASERIRKTIERMGLPTDQGVIQYSISIGAATLMPFDQFLDDLLIRADKALFSAKTKGRNRSCFYEV